MKIESTDQDIRTLLSSGYYSIPRFQRPYSWDRENIQDFWDDIIRERPYDYFIGSMVVYKEGNQKYGVVDGQQRLTTITILLCVLRNKLDEIGDKDLAHGIQGLIERKNIDNKPEFILSTESSYPYFQDHIQKWGDPDTPINPMSEEARLRDAYEQLTGLVDETVASISGTPAVSDQKKADRIKKELVGIRDSLLDLKLIFVKLDDEDDAYIIFETLNTRGKDLALTDLVKNHLTKHLKTKSASVDQTKIKWNHVLETIEGSAAPLESDAFIHHFWLSRYEYLPARKLFKGLRKYVTKSQAAWFLDALVTDAAHYRAIHERAYAKWSKQEIRIAEALDALQLFRVRQPTPLILSVVRAYKDGKLKKKSAERALVTIERFHFLFTAATSQHSSGGISGMYAALARRLYNAKPGDEAAEIIKELQQKLRDRLPAREEVVASFPTITYTDNFTKNRKLVRYILVQLDYAEHGDKGKDYDQMTIEHLVPQSAIDEGSFPEELVGQLGNLILVPQSLNSELSEKSLKQKQAILESRGYSMPDEFASSEVDVPEAIRMRTQRLAKAARDSVWAI